ncbi:unnamed protein product [Boreogadus saida]
MSGDMGALSGDVGALSGDVGALSGDMGALSGDMGALSEHMGALSEHMLGPVVLSNQLPERCVLLPVPGSHCSSIWSLQLYHTTP